MPRQNLALKRRMMGVISQAEVARALGTRPEHINRVLNGYRQSQRVIEYIEAELERRGALQEVAS
ncbi:MAG: hypothetical protein ACFBZ8_10410 [Opitutales bacterium]